MIDVDVRYLPGQEPEEIKAAVNELADATVVKVFHRRPAIVARDNPFVQALGEAISRVGPPDRRPDLRGPRRRLGRDLVPRGRRARG